MATTDGTFAQWLNQADVAAERLVIGQAAVLQAAFHYRQQVGTDYYSTRVLSHFLLHSGCGIPVAQIARLLAISRPTASRQQGVASKEVIQSAHHRMAGRPHGKLLPRFAGPIAEFILSHPDAGRFDTLEFIERTWGVHVSTVALHHFLKKYGLDAASRAAVRANSNEAAAVEPATSLPAPGIPAEPPAALPPRQPVPLPAPPFSSRRRNTRGRSC